MNKQRTVYAMVDPRSGAVRYIGCTVHELRDRLRHHYKRLIPYPNRPVCKWLAELRQAGLRPTMQSLQVIPADGDWQEAEKAYIKTFRSEGADLTNLADGGIGVRGVAFTEERKAHLSAKFKGRVFTPEWCAKISAVKLARNAAKRSQA